MRQTNFEVGSQMQGYDSVYLGQYRNYGRTNLRLVDKESKNQLEKSHWDHSRSWSQNFRTE